MASFQNLFDEQLDQHGGGHAEQGAARPRLRAAGSAHRRRFAHLAAGHVGHRVLRRALRRLFRRLLFHGLARILEDLLRPLLRVVGRAHGGCRLGHGSLLLALPLLGVRLGLRRRVGLLQKGGAALQHAAAEGIATQRRGRDGGVLGRLLDVRVPGVPQRGRIVRQVLLRQRAPGLEHAHALDVELLHLALLFQLGNLLVLVLVAFALVLVVLALLLALGLAGDAARRLRRPLLWFAVGHALGQLVGLLFGGVLGRRHLEPALPTTFVLAVLRLALHAARLLDGVHDLVGQELLPFAAGGIVFTGAQVDVLSRGVGARVDRVGGLGRGGAGVNADVAQVGA